PDGRDPRLRPPDGAAAGLGADGVAVPGVLVVVGPPAQRSSRGGSDLRLPDAPGDRAREVGAQGQLRVEFPYTRGRRAGYLLTFSSGHYSIGRWAALAEAGHLEGHDLGSYGGDGATLIMSTLERHPPLIELTGGSLGHGLGVAAGLAVGYRIRGRPARIFNFMTDGEIQEGSTWEAAMFAGHERLGNLVNVIDVNRTQADGDLVLEIEPVVEKFRSFGWWAAEAEGNDLDSLRAGLARGR